MNVFSLTKKDRAIFKKVIMSFSSFVQRFGVIIVSNFFSSFTSQLWAGLMITYINAKYVNETCFKLRQKHVPTDFSGKMSFVTHSE